MATNFTMVHCMAPEGDAIIAISSVFSPSRRTMKIHIFSHFELTARKVVIRKVSNYAQFESNFWLHSSSAVKEPHNQYQPDSISSGTSGGYSSGVTLYMNTIVIRALRPLKIERRCSSRAGILFVFEAQEKIVNNLSTRFFADRDALLLLSNIADGGQLNLLHNTTVPRRPHRNPDDDEELYSGPSNSQSIKEEPYGLPDEQQTSVVSSPANSSLFQSQPSTCSSQASQSYCASLTPASAPSPSLLPASTLAAPFGTRFTSTSPFSSGSSCSIASPAAGLLPAIPAAPTSASNSARPIRSNIESDFCPRRQAPAASAAQSSTAAPPIEVKLEVAPTGHFASAVAVAKPVEVQVAGEEPESIESDEEPTAPDEDTEDADELFSEMPPETDNFSFNSYPMMNTCCGLTPSASTSSQISGLLPDSATGLLPKSTENTSSLSAQQNATRLLLPSSEPVDVDAPRSEQTYSNASAPTAPAAQPLANAALPVADRLATGTNGLRLQLEAPFSRSTYDMNQLSALMLTRLTLSELVQLQFYLDRLSRGEDFWDPVQVPDSLFESPATPSAPTGVSTAATSALPTFEDPRAPTPSLPAGPFSSARWTLSEPNFFLFTIILTWSAITSLSQFNLHFEFNRLLHGFHYYYYLFQSHSDKLFHHLFRICWWVRCYSLHFSIWCPKFK